MMVGDIRYNQQGRVVKRLLSEPVGGHVETTFSPIHYKVAFECLELFLRLNSSEIFLYIIFLFNICFFSLDAHEAEI